MRNMSFALTTRQFLDGSKTVTRRLGWKSLRIGDRFRACVKCMGLRKGEKVQVLGECRVVNISREPLNAITDDDVAREGFPGMTAAEFVAMFCRHMTCQPGEIVTRIEFERVGVNTESERAG